MNMPQTYPLGTRRELFVDGVMADELEGGARLVLNHPTPQNVIFEGDRPWEGNMCGFVGVVPYESGYRLYHKAIQINLPGQEAQKSGREEIKNSHFFITCLESTDGIHWTRPELDEYLHDGKTKTNVVWQGFGPEKYGIHGFTAFVDGNPACPPEKRFKAVGSCEYSVRNKTLWAMHSADGLHWSLSKETPLLKGFHFDSQNQAFWDSLRGEYRIYFREFHDGRRDVMTATSPDFEHWSTPCFIDQGDVLPVQLYTNQINPYPRAPHLLLGLPARYCQRKWCRGMEILPEREHREMRSSHVERFGTSLSDGGIMASRDGEHFYRWEEAFLRPGPSLEGNWTYGDNYPGLGLIQTPSSVTGAPDELSFYAVENYWRNPSRFRRYSIRMDGFVSVNGTMAGGSVATPVITMEGEQLSLNISTSAYGYARVQLETPDGKPIPGYAFDDCHEIFGDLLDYPVAWKDHDNCSALKNKPLRMRVELHDADLYSFRFCEQPAK